jgi:alkylation response protein AidB-like acyl-CoA dehydrogenase
MATLDDVEQQIVATVRQFVDRDAVPVASALERANAYPEALIEQMKALGVYGLVVPEQYGGLGV